MNETIRKKWNILIEKEYVLFKYWSVYYKVKYWVKVQKHKVKEGVFALVGICIFLMAMINLAIFSNINQAIERYFSSGTQLHNLQSLLNTLSGSLLAVTAIAFSFVMFAMQINVERMPYGLFRKFSSDTTLSIYFLALFLIPLIIGTLSIVSNLSLIPWILIGTFGAVIFIVVLLFMAYKRALKLISPIEQLKILSKTACKSLIDNSKAASRFAPFLKEQSEKNNASKQLLSFDIYRFKCFQYHPDWTLLARRNLHYAFLFAKKYAVDGDDEISKYSMDTIQIINLYYIAARGKTFIVDSFSIIPQISQDKFINETLEYFRIYTQEGFSTGNEKFIKQFFYGIKQICLLYLDIDYSDREMKHKPHANLATSYFAELIETASSYKLSEVAIIGFRMLEEIASSVIIKGEINDLIYISEKISVISTKSLENEKTAVITCVGIEQLARITFSILKSGDKNGLYMLNKLQEQLFSIAEIALNLDRHHIKNILNDTLQPYFSTSSSKTLAFWLTELANDILKIEDDRQSIKNIIENIALWSKKLPQMQRKLLLLAVNLKSTFLSSIIYWVEQMLKIFLALSRSVNCPENYRVLFIESSENLISIFSYIPDDEKAVRFVEMYNLVYKLFSSSLEAKEYNYYDTAFKIRQILFSWTFKLYKNSCGIGENIYALVCLNILLGLDDDILIDKITHELGLIPIDNKNVLSALSFLKDKINQCGILFFSTNQIDAKAETMDQNKLRNLLEKVYDCFKQYV